MIYGLFTGSEFVEAAPLKPCADLVINSRKERKLREDLEKERELEAKSKGKKGENESDINVFSPRQATEKVGKQGASTGKGSAGTKVGPKKKK